MDVLGLGDVGRRHCGAVWYVRRAATCLAVDLLRRADCCCDHNRSLPTFFLANYSRWKARLAAGCRGLDVSSRGCRPMCCRTEPAFGIARRVKDDGVAVRDRQCHRHFVLYDRH
mgnify:CR=1 FL=1